jgi:hypothetical protein
MARLKRTLSLGSVVLFGIAYMTPIIVLGTFGILADVTRGVVPSAYLVASVAMLFTALSYGRMAAAFPVRARPIPTCASRSARNWASSPAGRCCWTTCSCPWPSG